MCVLHVYRYLLLDKNDYIITEFKSILTSRLYKYQKEMTMQRKTKSLLEELNEFAVEKNKESVLEARAVHIIDSAVNFLTLVREKFDPETAYELERRFINSIKGADSAKFIRGIRKLRDTTETVKNLRIVVGNVKNTD